jgi:hypothetical protein
VSRGPSDRDYVERLGAVLRTRDSAQLRAFLTESARRFGGADQAKQVEGQSDEEVEILLHRMTLARSDLSEYHAASRLWLQQHGIGIPPSDRARRN